MSRDLLERVQTDTIRSVADGIDIIATAQVIDRLQLRELLALVFDRSATGDTFTSSIMEGIRTYVRRMIGLARVATGMENGHEAVLNRLMVWTPWRGSRLSQRNCSRSSTRRRTTSQ